MKRREKREADIGNVQFIMLVLALASATAIVATMLRRRSARGHRPEEPAMRLPRGVVAGAHPRVALRRLCNLSAEALGAHVAIFLNDEGKPRFLAASARKPRLEALDQIAAEWALAHCIPTGRGSGVQTGSDWQFQPVFRHGLLRGLVAVAGRGGREPVLPHQSWLLEDVLSEAGVALERLAPAGSHGRAPAAA